EDATVDALRIPEEDPRDLALREHEIEAGEFSRWHRSADLFDGEDAATILHEQDVVVALFATDEVEGLRGMPSDVERLTPRSGRTWRRCRVQDVTEVHRYVAGQRVDRDCRQPRDLVHRE